MSFKRTWTKERVSGPKLDHSLRVLGVNISTQSRGNRSEIEYDVEWVLISAFHESLRTIDTRILGLLLDWLEKYSDWVSVERLMRLLPLFCESIEKDDAQRLRAFVASLHKEFGDARFRKLRSLHRGAPVAFSEFSDRSKQDSRIDPTRFIIGGNSLSRRPGQIFEPERVCRTHPVIRARLEYGVGHRATLVAALSELKSLKATVSPSTLAQLAFCPYATAHRFVRDLQLLGNLSPQRF